MFTIEVEAKDEKDIKGKIAKLANILPPIVKALALHLKGKIATYPPERHGPMIWSEDPEKRARQRRGFFAKLNAGEIEVPYRRGSSPGSETLGRKWTIEEVGPFEAKIGNAASYGPFVQDPEKQSRYHQMTGWPTTQDVIDKEGPEVVKVAEKLVKAALEK